MNALEALKQDITSGKVIVYSHSKTASGERFAIRYNGIIFGLTFVKGDIITCTTQPIQRYTFEAFKQFAPNYIFHWVKIGDHTSEINISYLEPKVITPWMKHSVDSANQLWWVFARCGDDISTSPMFKLISSLGESRFYTRVIHGDVEETRERFTCDEPTTIELTPTSGMKC